MKNKTLENLKKDLKPVKGTEFKRELIAPEDVTPKNTVVSYAIPTEDEINYVLKDGINAQVKMNKVTEILKADFWNRDKKTNSSVLTEKLDFLLNVDSKTKNAKGKMVSISPTVRKNVKSFIRKTIQPTVKNSACQDALLEDDVKTKTVTFKKVTVSFIENPKSEKYPLGKYADKWTSADLDSYRVVVEHKAVKPEINLIEALDKFREAHQLNIEHMFGLCELLRDNVTELPKGFLD